MSMIEIAEFSKGLLEIFPIVIMVNNVTNITVESSNHTFTDDKLGECDFSTKVWVRAEDN